jgi:hypothetical protein
MLVPPFNLMGWFFCLYFYLYQMKWIVLSIVTAIFFSCKKNNKELKEWLTVADSVAINYFRGDGSMDTVVLVKIIGDKKTLQQLINLITEALIKEKPGCGYDGSLHFFKNNMVMQDIYFRMNNEDCSQFTFSFSRESVATKLPEEAKKLLQQLQQ